MADFRPETTVYLFRNTCVDDENQPYFESESAKLAWYNAHSPKSYEEYSYQRENRQYIRVQDKAENLRMYDMMCFHNSATGRYVFCRIMEIEFINPNTTEITYEVDYMQTYVDVIKFGPCWVEREMWDDDWYGSQPAFESQQPEGIECGRMTRVNLDVQNQLGTPFLTKKLVMLSALNDEALPILTATSTLGQYSFVSVMNKFQEPYGRDGAQALCKIIERYAEKDLLNAIIGIYVVPDVDPLIRVNLPIDWTNIHGYQVVNSKCWSSEFCHFVLSNRQGNEVMLDTEYFGEQTNIRLDIESVFCDGLGGSFMYPTTYPSNPKGQGVFAPWNTSIPFAGSGYYDWFGQNAGQAVASAGSSMISSAMTGILVGKPFEAAALSGMASVMASAGKVRDSFKNPIYTTGPGNGNVFAHAINTYGFTCELECPSAFNVQVIDEFFGKYGYRTNLYKVPNVNTRPKWNYVKTSGAVCNGPFPKKAQLAMEALMNKGVTFWHLGGGENISDDWKIIQNKQ